MTENKDYKFDHNNYNNDYNYHNDADQDYVDIYTDRPRRTCERRRPARQEKGAGIVIAALAFAMVAVIAATVFSIRSFAVKPNADTPQPTITAVAEKNANKNAEKSAQPAQQTAQKDDDNIRVIDGDRVYIDTKRTAPATTGNSADYIVHGKTSYGFDWNYNADNSNFVIRCDYNFNKEQYNFHFYGTAPGTAHVTLLYNTDDNTQVPVPLTVTVDDGLNVSLA